MSFSDIFKSNFLENVTEISVLDIFIGLAVGLIIGLFICLIYKKTFNGVMYSSSFALTLVGLTLVTVIVIMAITSNVVLSLGMVGALSIVRFRSAIKEPVEIVYLFWSIAAGIVVGAGMIPLAAIGSAIVGITLIVLANHKSRTNPYILVLSCTDEQAETAAMELVRSSVSRCVIKSKTVTSAGIELTAEIRSAGSSTSFVNRLEETVGVSRASLVSYNGEYLA